MSLTSYRAAPPRWLPRGWRGMGDGVWAWSGRPGGDRLSRVLRRSTMGAGGFHGRVRDGIGWSLPAMATRSSGPRAAPWWGEAGAGRVLVRSVGGWCVCVVSGAGRCRGRARAGAGGPGMAAAHDGKDRAGRAIRIGWLSASPHVYLRPIDVMVYHGPRGDLVSRWVSRLDAFSGYPVRTWLPGGAAGATTGPPEVRPSRSSRTRDSSSQVSFTHGR